LTVGSQRRLAARCGRPEPPAQPPAPQRHSARSRPLAAQAAARKRPGGSRRPA